MKRMNIFLKEHDQFVENPSTCLLLTLSFSLYQKARSTVQQHSCSPSLGWKLQLWGEEIFCDCVYKGVTVTTKGLH